MNRNFIYGLLMLISFFMIVIWWPVNDSNCSSVTLLKLKKEILQIPAAEVVVKPWLGEHHVYGIFQVSDEYKESKFFMLSIPGDRKYCFRHFGYKQNFDDVFAIPGHHLIKKHIRSRIAVKMIFQGKYFKLNNPQNWTLTFPKLKVN